eukprot:m.31227 g.31227  ORF g.31227 m.31227 type:complete len:245 (-) comp12298_c0_seq1:1535-2269(-)
MPVDLAAAAAGRDAPTPDLMAAQIRKDKKEAVRLARLKMKANARGAAPPPPKKGAAPAPVIASASDGAPPKVEKFRAVVDHTGEVTFTKGATLFVLGEPDASGNVVAVFAGKSGSIPASTLIPITDELLAKERAEKDTEIEESRKQKEANLEAAKSDIEAEERAKLDKLSEKERAQAMASAASGEAGQSEEDKMAAAASAAAAAKMKEENAALLAEENRLKAEAARLEELMRQLDMSDDDDDEM